MRKFLVIAAFALVGTLGLSACSNHSNNNQAASSAHVKVSRPTSPTNTKAWEAYLSQIVEAHMGKITNPPFVYYVPSAQVPGNNATLTRVQKQLNTVIARTVLPGNMVAVGGPSSTTTAKVMETAFQNATPGSFKGVTVLFIGNQSDEAAVKQAVTPSGAKFEFAQM